MPFWISGMDISKEKGATYRLGPELEIWWSYFLYLLWCTRTYFVSCDWFSTFIFTVNKTVVPKVLKSFVDKKLLNIFCEFIIYSFWWCCTLYMLEYAHSDTDVVKKCCEKWKIWRVLQSMTSNRQKYDWRHITCRFRDCPL